MNENYEGFFLFTEHCDREQPEDRSSFTDACAIIPFCTQACTGIPLSTQTFTATLLFTQTSTGFPLSTLTSATVPLSFGISTESNLCDHPAETEEASVTASKRIRIENVLYCEEQTCTSQETSRLNIFLCFTPLIYMCFYNV
jgi:hypothetical protein